MHWFTGGKWPRGLTGTVCQPRISLSSYPGSQPTVYSVAVLCRKAAEGNEFTFARMFSAKFSYAKKGITIIGVFIECLSLYSTTRLHCSTGAKLLNGAECHQVMIYCFS